MVKKVILLNVLFIAFLCVAPFQAYELMNGPTQLIQYNASKAYEGYTLFISGGKIYLIDMLGYVVHTWAPETISPGMHFVLLENGHILGNTGGGGPGGPGAPGGPGGQRGMPGAAGGQGGMPGGPGGQGGMPPGGAGGGMAFGGSVKGLVELDWDGNIVWQYEPGEGDGSLHHDFCRLPNGNTLTNATETVSYEEAIAAGRRADQLTERGLAADAIYEIDPDGNIVWRWRSWDHRGSNSKSNLDVNFITYVIPEHSNQNPDWTHYNDVDYDPDTDRILVSSREFAEIYIIDHKTGDILYRWGNPSAYGAGKVPTLSTPGDQILFGPHDAEWIKKGLPGAGNILIFNNGWGRSPISYSSIIEMNPKTDEIVWEYSRGFFSDHISGCQRLPNGNTFVCSGNHSHLFEVTSEGDVVWEYVVATSNWSTSTGGAPGGPAGPGAPGGRGGQGGAVGAGGPGGQGGAVGAGGPAGPGAPGGGGNLFRAHRYGPDYPGLAGRDLKPQGQFVEDVKEGWKPRVDLTGATQAGAKLWEELWK